MPIPESRYFAWTDQAARQRVGGEQVSETDRRLKMVTEDNAGLRWWFGPVGGTVCRRIPDDRFPDDQVADDHVPDDHLRDDHPRDDQRAEATSVPGERSMDDRFRWYRPLVLARGILRSGRR